MKTIVRRFRALSKKVSKMLEVGRKSLSKKDLDSYKYNKELREWLIAHGNPVGEKYQEEFENKRYYNQFMKSLTTDRRPMDTASLILSTENLASDIPVPVSRVGKVVRQRLQSEISKQPELSLLSPAVVLAQKRRKEVISKIQTGNWPLDYNPLPITVQESDDLSVDLATKQHSKFLPADVLTSPKKFEPKWEHYDTMKSRWKYVRPQTRQLVQEYIAPETSTSYLRMRGTKLYGSQQDLNYFQSQVESQSFRASRILDKSGTLN